MKELGQEPSDELKSLQIPDEMRKLRFTKEDLEKDKVDAAEKLKKFGRKPEDRSESRVIEPVKKEGEL